MQETSNDDSDSYFDAKTEVQLDNQVYDYTGGDDFDPNSEVKLE